jgi:hypothetical protein
VDGRGKAEGGKSLKAGAVFAEGVRRYKVLAVTAETVEYLDCYAGPVAIRRVASRTQWELDVRSGALRSVPKL